MSIKTDGAGHFGGVGAPFPIGTKMSSDNTELAKLLGLEITGKNGRVFRLYQYVGSASLTGAYGAGTNRAGARGFAPVAGNLDDPLTQHKVDLAVLGGTKPTNRAVGYALKDQVDLVQNDYFWLQVDGDYFDLWMGDDTTDVAPGDYLQLDDDTDLGAVKGSGTTFSAEFSAFVSMSTQAGNDALIQGRPIHKLRG